MEVETNNQQQIEEEGGEECECKGHTLVVFNSTQFYIPDDEINNSTRKALRFAGMIGTSEHECFYTKKNPINTRHPEKFAKTEKEAKANGDLFVQATSLFKKGGGFLKFKANPEDLMYEENDGCHFPITNVYVWESL